MHHGQGPNVRTTLHIILSHPIVLATNSFITTNHELMEGLGVGNITVFYVNIFQ